jgi:REP element-mobilizing transposase RayT
MGRIPRIHFPGAIFHVMARGNARQNILLSGEDREFFLDILSDLKTARPFRLYAYCLMSNHLHLVVEPAASTISTIMNVLLTRYAKYFNARLKRTGHVFQERFRAPLCQRGDYFQALVRYIHLNPVRAGIAVEPSAWPYSGHRAYLGQSRRRLIDQGLLLSMFDEDIEAARAAYLQFILDGMPSGPAVAAAQLRPPEPLSVACPQGMPGDLVDAAPPRASLEDMAMNCAAMAGISRESLRSATKMRDVCRVRRELMRTALGAGYSMTEVAIYLGQTVAAVSKALSTAQIS